MHYAKRGIITPEMEYIAIRENQSRYIQQQHNGQSKDPSLLKQHPGQAWGAHIPSTITAEFVRE